MPRIFRATSSNATFGRRVLVVGVDRPRRGSELGAPLSDRLVADDEAALGEQVRHVTEAEVDAKVQPHGERDDLRRETIASIL
jgi:hypothetical protein